MQRLKNYTQYIVFINNFITHYIVRKISITEFSDSLLATSES